MQIRTMTRVALFAALTAVGAFIRIPLGYSSITLQTFFTAMAGCVLGPWYGALSQLVYVALGLVFVQHLLHLQIQRPVIRRQALGQILMYRGFADAEFPGRRAHRGPVFYQVKGQLTGPFLHVPFDSAPLLSHTMHHHYMPGFPAAELRLFPCHGSRILV